ncbi:hypothetical protein AAY473_034384 [Plecturocebus cupreus]
MSGQQSTGRAILYDMMGQISLLGCICPSTVTRAEYGLVCSNLILVSSEERIGSRDIQQVPYRNEDPPESRELSTSVKQTIGSGWSPCLLGAQCQRTMTLLPVGGVPKEG